MPDQIRWDDRPCFGPDLPVQVFSVPPNSQFYFRLLGTHVGLFYHWVKTGRTWKSEPCVVGNCQHCRKAEPDWKAFAPALVYFRNRNPSWEPCVMELTVSCFRDFEKAIDPCKARGAVVSLERGNTSSRVRCKLIAEPDGLEAALPPPFDVKLVLLRLFNLSKPRSADGSEVSVIPPADIKPIDLPPPIEPRKADHPAIAGVLPKLGTGKYRRKGGAQ